MILSKDRAGSGSVVRTPHQNRLIREPKHCARKEAEIVPTFNRLFSF